MRTSPTFARGTSRRRLAAVAVLALLALPLIAAAQPNTTTYLTRHTWGVFTLTAQPAPPTVEAYWYCHAWGLTQSPFAAATDVTPSPQSTIWAPFGEDRAREGFPSPFQGPVPTPVVNRSGPVTPWVNCQEGTLPVPVPAGGLNQWQANVAITDATADAQALSWVRPTAAPFYPMLGIHQTWGQATADNTVSFMSAAYAFSWCSQTVRGYVGPRFRFFWGPNLAVTSAWSHNRRQRLRARRVRDPINFVVLADATGDTLDTGNLLSIVVELPAETAPPTAAGTQAFSWQDNTVEVVGDAALFEITMNDAYVDSNWGALRLVVQDSLVSEATAEGGFAAVPLPAAGTQTPFTFPLDTLIQFTADLQTGPGELVSLTFEGSAMDDPGDDPFEASDVPAAPTGGYLQDATPNPFNPTTEIAYGLVAEGRVTLRVHDAAGRLVRTLVDAVQAPRSGGRTVTWDGTDDQGRRLASGVYLLSLEAVGIHETGKVVLVK